MDISSLTLHPYGKPALLVELSKNDRKNSITDQIISKETDVCIFSDLSYEFALSYAETSSIQKVDVYINDVYEPCAYNNGRILFPNKSTSKSTSDRRIFIDCYGFVEITIVLYDIDGIEHQYSTNYLPVLVRRGELNHAVEAMIKYVYSNQELLLLNGEPKAINSANLKENGYQNLSAQIILAEEIATIYESNYGYFKANSRFRIDKVSKIDRFERLQYVTPATVQFIATHPEELRQMNGNSGMRIRNRFYQPEKTLSLQNERSYDIYENRVVLGFIGKMIDSINELHAHCYSLLEQIPSNADYSTEYIYSPFFMFAQTKKMLENGLSRLSNLRKKFAYLWAMYSNCFRIKPEAMSSEPHLSPIFMSVPQYHRVFVQIHEWFKFGIYDFSKEKFMLSFIKISSLYEAYLLAKIISYFEERGYTRESSEKRSYPTECRWKYKNTNCNNTFVFKKQLRKITLYYQPVIYDTDKRDINGIGLIRNNSIPVFTGENDDDRVGGHYYSPDYLIKAADDSCIRYLILDAKFSDFTCLRRYHIKDLTFKYLFSISPIQTTESIAGLCLIYGKCNSSERMQSVYDKCLPNQQITPIVEALPLIEGVANDGHYSNLDTLMRKFIT